MKCFIPGGEKKWTSLLPGEYRDNPEVIVSMAPNGSRATIEEMNDGAYLGILISPRGTRRCLQVLDPPLVGWIEHQMVAERHGLEMLAPEYIGPLEDIPQRFLLASVRFPLIFLKDKLFEKPLNLRNHLREIHQESNV